MTIRKFQFEINDDNNNDINNILAQYSAIQGELSTIHFEIAEHLQAKLHKAFNFVFVANPSLKAISWTQYTPHFMDGDECIFTVNSPNFLNFIPEEFLEFYEDELPNPEDFALEASDIPTSKYFTPEGKLEIKNFLNFILKKDAFMKDAFGDDVHVLMTPDYIQIEPYEHD